MERRSWRWRYPTIPARLRVGLMAEEEAHLTYQTTAAAAGWMRAAGR